MEETVDKGGMTAHQDHGQSGALNVMGTANVGKLLIKFSVPAIIGMLCNAFQNIVNRIFVGQEVGKLALAAVSVNFPVMIVYFALAMLIGIGATTLTAIRLGQKRHDEAEQLLGQATLMLFIIPVILMVIGYIFMEPILLAAGATEANLPYAKDYLSVLLPAMIFCVPCMGINNFIRTEGSPRVSMYTQILSSVINVIVNYICVVQLQWGVKGAALGILIGNVVSLAWVLSYFLGKRSFLKIRMKNLRIKFSMLTKICALGMAPFLMQIANCIQQFIMNRTVVDLGGDNGLAVVSVITSLSSLLVMPLVGINQGSQPIIGYNYGAGIYKRVKDTLITGIIYATVLGILFFALVMLFATPMADMFTKDEPLLTEMTAHALKVYFCMLPIIGSQIVSSGYFQATGKPVHSAVLSLSRQVLVFIPALLIMPKWMGIEGVWISAPIADGVATIVTLFMIILSLRSLNKLKTADDVGRLVK